MNENNMIEAIMNLKCVKNQNFFSAITLFSIGLAPIIALQLIQPWQQHFFDTGGLIFLGNMARLLLLTTIPLSCLGAAWCIRRPYLLGSDRLEDLLLNVIFGFCILSWVGYILAYFAFMTRFASIVVLVLTTGYASLILPKFCSAKKIFRSKKFFAFLAIVIAYCGIFAVCPPSLDNDYAHYFPYLSAVKETEALGPFWFFITHFYLQGSGLSLLTVSATDELSIQMMGAFLLIVISMIVYLSVLRLSRVYLIEMSIDKPSPQWMHSLASYIPLLAGFSLLLQERLLKTPLFKVQHLATSALICTAFLLGQKMVGAESGGPINKKSLTGLLYVISATVALLTPVAVPFYMVCLVGFLITEKLIASDGDREISRKFLNAIAIACLTMVLIISNNLSRTGLLEYSPLSLTLPLQKSEVLSSWTSTLSITLHANALDEYYREGANGGNVTFQATKYYLLVGYLLVSLLIIVILLLYRERLRPWIKAFPDAPMLLSIYVPWCAVFFAIYVVAETFPGRADDLRRMTIFIPAYFPVICAAIIIPGFTSVKNRHSALFFYKKATTRIFAIIFGTIGLILLLAFRVPLANSALSRFNAMMPRLLFFVGEVSAATSVGHYLSECRTVAEIISKESKVFVMFFSPGCYVTPGIQFLNGTQNPLDKSLAKILFGKVDDVENILMQAKVNYFLVTIDEKVGFFSPPILFSPIFDTSALVSKFRIKILSEQVALLSLNGTEADGDLIQDDGPWLQSFNAYREKQRQSYYGRAIMRFKSQ